MRTRLNVLVVCVTLASLLCPAAAGEYELKDGKLVPVPAPVKGTAVGELARIRKYLEAGHERTAIRAAKKFLKNYPDNAGCEEAMILAGQAEMNRGRYYQAYEWFEKQIGRYPGGVFFERALLREYEVAEAFLKGKKRIVAGVFRLSATEEGLEILMRIAEHVPGTELAETALLRIGDHHFAKGDFLLAAEAYDNHLALLPKSARAEYSMLQAARSMYAAYQGFKYDETPLIEAEQRFRTFAERHPRAVERAGVEGILQRITEQRAQKLFETARFYERTGRKSAAAFYYRQVIETYPRTMWATRARTALGAGESAGSPAPSEEEPGKAAPANPQPGKAVPPNPQPGKAAPAEQDNPVPAAQEGKVNQ